MQSVWLGADFALAPDDAGTNTGEVALPIPLVPEYTVLPIDRVS